MVSILVQVRHLRAIGVVLGSCGRAPQAKQLLLAPSRQAHTPPSRNTGASAASESHNTMSAPATNYEAKQAARKQVKEALKGLSVETMAKESKSVQLCMPKPHDAWRKLYQV